MNELIFMNDIKTIKSFIHILKELYNTNIDYLYFYELVDNKYEYWSNIEYELVGLNSIGYPIGYTTDIIYQILNSKYDKKELNLLCYNNDTLLLDLFKIAYKDFKLKDLNYLIEFLKDNINNDMAFNYFITSLDSDIKDIDKFNFIIDSL